MDGLPKVTELYAGIALDEDGTEGLAAVRTSEGWMPLVCVKPDNLVSLKERAKFLSNVSGRPVALVKFGTRLDIETITPETDSNAKG